MNTVKFTAHVATTREYCQLDGNSKTIPRDKQTKFCAELLVSCVNSDNTIDVEFLVRTQVPLSQVEKGDDRGELANSVGLAMAMEGLPKLAKYAQLTIYGGQAFTFPQDYTIPRATEVFERETECEINDQLAAQLREATARHRECSSRLEMAKEYLTQNVDSFRNDAVLARKNARFVVDYMRMSSNPFMGGWNNEKSGLLLVNLEELIKRKNTNHHGYVQAAEWIRRTLYSVRPSKLWHERPLSVA